MQHNKLLFIVFLLFCFHLKAESTNQDWVKTLPKPWLISESEISELLPEFNKRFPDFKQRVRAIAQWRLGTPYKIFNLGEEQGPDPDPIFRMDVSDCTSHVLTTLSLAHSNSWQEARENMIAIHYKANDSGYKTPTYSKRWHYTSDRIQNHPLTPSLSAGYVPEDKLTKVSITLNQKADGTEFLALNWTRQADVFYIPNDQITDAMLNRLPGLVGIAFVRKSYFKMGIVTAHEGMLLDGDKLLHAGQDAGLTVLESFKDYYFTEKGPKFDGIMLFDFVHM